MGRGRGMGRWDLCRWLLVPALVLGGATGTAAQEDAAARGAAHLQAGEWTEAVAAFREAVGAAPEDGTSWLRLGRALVELGRADEALDALDRAREAGLETPFVDLFRARALAGAGRRGEALDALEAMAPTPALGGAESVRGTPEFAGLVGDPRFQAVLAAVEAAAWPCRTAEASREFDFWIGTWDVFVSGRQAGTNVVESMLGGCALLENWTNVRGREGKSFNWVDGSTFRDARWRQLWVDDSGNTLDYYDGHYADGAMRFRGHTISPTGDSIPQKLTFYDVHPDTVRQLFEQSNDGGENWVVTFDGIYVRRR